MRIVVRRRGRHEALDREPPRTLIDGRIDHVLRHDVEFGGRRPFLQEHFADGREDEAAFLLGKAGEPVDGEDREDDRADAPDEELTAAQAESLRISRGDVDEEVVEHGRVHERSNELTERGEPRAGRGVRSEESSIEEGKDCNEDDARGGQGVEGHHERSASEPSLHFAERESVNSGKDEEDEDGGDEAEHLRAFPEGSDGEGFELAGDSIDDEFLRDLRQEHAEAEPSQDEGDRESAPAGQGSGPEPDPRKAPDRSGNRLPQGTHADRTPGASLEPMPAS